MSNQPQHDPIADALDDMAALALHWQRTRARGRTPGSVRAAMLQVAREVAKLDAAAMPTPLDGSGLELRLIQALSAEGIHYVEHAQALTDACLLRLPNVGRASVQHLRAWKKSGA